MDSIKAHACMSDQNALGKLHLLDGSDIKSWAINVSKPAIEIADSFLAGHGSVLPANCQKRQTFPHA